MGWNKIDGKMVWLDRKEELQQYTKEELINMLYELEMEQLADEQY